MQNSSKIKKKLESLNIKTPSQPFLATFLTKTQLKEEECKRREIFELPNEFSPFDLSIIETKNNSLTWIIYQILTNSLKIQNYMTN